MGNLNVSVGKKNKERNIEDGMELLIVEPEGDDISR